MLADHFMKWHDQIMITHGLTWAAIALTRTLQALCEAKKLMSRPTEGSWPVGYSLVRPPICAHTHQVARLPESIVLFPNIFMSAELVDMIIIISIKIKGNIWRDFIKVNGQEKLLSE